MSETVILADKGYQGLQKIHSNTFLPIKTSKNNPKTSKIKIFNKNLFRIFLIKLK
ncbi:hypothetical protein [Spiroplasma endosymbiont of Melieria omissa]|uniref:hypothetical protein n=1 Tax=Spiroplasma endosymbiont of Melieria omissa TaxID=3139324 RepID=UPI003CCA8DB5